MFRVLQRHLRLIRYYSASSKRTRWSTATDIAMIIAVVLAPLLVWLMNSLIVTQRINTEVFGRTMFDSAGSMRAELVNKERLLSPWPSGMTPVGEFHLFKAVELGGWPVRTASIARPPQLDLTLTVDRQLTTNVTFNSNDAELASIAATLRAKEHDALTDEWRQAKSSSETLVLGWIFGSVLWCIMLWVVLLIAINITRFIVFIFSTKRQVRGALLRQANKCPNCGYDLRGLEFKDRCPECGQLSW